MDVVVDELRAFFTRVPTLAESKQMLKGESEYLRAMIDDIQDLESWVRRGKNRKMDDNLSVWVAEARNLLMVAENQLEQGDSLQDCIELTRVVNQFVATLQLHDRKGCLLFLEAFSDGGGPHIGRHIPVKELMGQASLRTLVGLEQLLHGFEVGQIAIHGEEGIGKTFLVKHLHNRVLNWGERSVYVFWVSSPDEFSIKLVQDAVAAAVKCDFSSQDDLNVRARELSDKLGDLGSFVLFLDGVPKADFTLEQIGIQAPAEGSACKLVCTTSSTALGCRMLDGFKTAELGRLSEEEAFQLFWREAKIDMGSVALLDDIPRLLARMCHGVPRRIVDTASGMFGISGLHEWKNALFEMGNLEKRRKFNMSGHYK